ncbi:MAG: glycerophosphodiester phosphodiesterase [Clostridia bacterium]|nr:glycerophosphodiester phosphodiesterase [Clostridia bacterium]
MKALFIILGVLLVLLGIYILLIAPGRRRDIAKYKGVKFAHRGLHNSKRAENSMSAFAAAADAGFGIELDVRLSSDGVLVVYHDDNLERVARREGLVIDYTAAELGKMNLLDTDDTIPRFRDVLRLIDGRVPLLIEIKEAAGDNTVSLALCEMLKDYKGDYIIESFNPLSLATVRKHLPSATRGILSHRYMAYEPYRKPLYFLLQSLLLNRLAGPAFIAYDHHHWLSGSLIIARLLGATTMAWTVRSLEEEKLAYKHGFDTVIFENYIPKI